GHALTPSVHQPRAFRRWRRGGVIKLAKPNWPTDLRLAEKAEYIVACSGQLMAPWYGRQAVQHTVFTPGASSASAADLFRYFVRALHFLPNTNSLHLRLAIGKLHLQRQNIDADKIRTRAIKRNEGGHLQRQALFVIGGGYPRFLYNDPAICRRRRQLDRRKWAGRTVRPHVDIDPHTNIRVRCSTRHPADALLLS